MKALFFILYAYLFIRGIILLFKKPKPGSSKMKANKKQRMFKLLFIVVIMLVNAILIILTDSFINILNIEHVMSLWIWLNGFGILLIELPWYGKYDISMEDFLKNKGETDSKDSSNKNNVVRAYNTSNIPLLGPDDPEEKSEEPPLIESKSGN